MNLTRRAGYLGKSVALWVFMGVAVLCTSLGALGFFVVAFLIWLSRHLGPSAAFAVAGGLLLLVTACIVQGFTLALRRMRARQPSLASEGMSTLSLVMRVATMAVRRDPRKAVLAALIAGALAEYFSAGGKPKA